METIAIYNEETIRVYGIAKEEAVCFSSLKLRGNEFLRVLPLYHALDAAEQNFLQQSVMEEDGDFIIHLYYRPIAKKLVADQAKEHKLVCIDHGLVDILFLHGPHFQERYGILLEALAALGSLPIATACAGTTIYLVFSRSKSKAAHEILTTTFLTPKAKH